MAITKSAKRLAVLEVKLKQLADELADKRSDISDILISLSEGTEEPTWLNDLEPRYKRFKINDMTLEYDSLTTLLMYSDDPKRLWWWEAIEIDEE